MWERFHQRGVHREHRVKQVREPDALCLRDEPEERAIAIEAPRPPNLDYLETRLVVTVDQLAGDPAGGVLVGELDGVRAVPLDVDDRGEAVGSDAAYAG